MVFKRRRWKDFSGQWSAHYVEEAFFRRPPGTPKRTVADFIRSWLFWYCVESERFKHRSGLIEKLRRIDPETIRCRKYRLREGWENDFRKPRNFKPTRRSSDTVPHVPRIADVPPEPLDFAAGVLRHAKRVVFFTGAGMSKESGIPTFRDALDGIWENFGPEELATPEAFEANPSRVREFYEYRREFVRKAKPNAGHAAIARMERIFDDLTVITQNVDCLHEAAGSTHVLSLHGEILSNRCNRGCPGTQPGSRTVCPSCGSDTLRPNVVWFGEALDPGVLGAAVCAVAEADVLVVVGTSGVVYPAAGIVDRAIKRKIPVIEVNPNPTPFTENADSVLPFFAGVVLPAILARLCPAD